MMAERLAKAARARTGPRHSMPLDILVVDDEEATRLSLVFALADAGHRVVEAADGEEALTALADRTFDVVMLDIRLPKVDGLTVFKRLRLKTPTTAVILMTAFATVSDAVACLRDGAYDYVTKPFAPEEFTLRVIGHIAEHRSLRHELEEARKLVASRDVGSPIIGHAPAMVKLLERLSTVAQSDAPVLIQGESGTGKELFAHTIHARSPRRDGPFVAVNCAAFPEDRIEVELFGHERGAFAGAVRRSEGRVAAADSGTLLLEEISTLPMSTQARLLRVLEEGTIEPLGATAPIPVNVRLITSTKVDLKSCIEQGRFREDLYFRVNVLDLEIPPLRERRADIPLLFAHFLRRFCPGRVPPGISSRAWSILHAYAFPGNVREFAHAVERAVALSHGSEIDVEHLPSDLARLARPSGTHETFRPLAVAIREFEKDYLSNAMNLAKGDAAVAAELLGLCTDSLREKLAQHGLESLVRSSA